MGCQALLQGVFPTQGWNPRLSCLLHWQVGSVPLAPRGVPSQFFTGEDEWWKADVAESHFYPSLALVGRRQWQPTPVLLPGESHRWRSLVGYSPWGREESDTTEQLHFHFSLSCTGEGNGNQLQCSCLDNPRDRGAWWAAVYGVAQSRT